MFNEPLILNLEQLPGWVPQVVLLWQAREVLRRHGLIDQVHAYMASDGADPAAKQAWEYAPSVSRGGPLVIALAALLGLSDEQLNEMFREAYRIAV